MPELTHPLIKRANKWFLYQRCLKISAEVVCCISLLILCWLMWVWRQVVFTRIRLFQQSDTYPNCLHKWLPKHQRSTFAEIGSSRVDRCASSTWLCWACINLAWEEFINARAHGCLLFWCLHVSLFVTCKAWHQCNERLRALSSVVIRALYKGREIVLRRASIQDRFHICVQSPFLVCASALHSGHCSWPAGPLWPTGQSALTHHNSKYTRACSRVWPMTTYSYVVVDSELSSDLTLKTPITTKLVCFIRLLKCLRSLYGKKCGPRSDCS